MVLQIEVREKQVLVHVARGELMLEAAPVEQRFPVFHFLHERGAEGRRLGGWGARCQPIGEQVIF